VKSLKPFKCLEWIGSSKRDLKKFPEEVQGAMGYALHLAQCGDKHGHAKPLKGMGSAKILEIKENDESGTYRTVYTLEMDEFVFVLHAFQKKSKSGIATPKPELDKIQHRLKEARELYKQLISQDNR